MSEPFDIHNFDSGLLDIPALLDLVHRPTTNSDWQLTHISSSSSHTLYRADPCDAETFPSLAIKLYHRTDRPRASREYQMMQALDDFGIRIAPRAFYASETLPILISEWVHGKPLKYPPSPNDEEMWHRLMAALGTPSHLPFAKYAKMVPMMGSVPQSPRDMMDKLDATLQLVDSNHELYEVLYTLTSHIREHIAPEWNDLPKTTLNHLDPLPHHFIWDGYHLRLVGWDNVDWTDTAFAVGQVCAHPTYEEVSSSHWVWYRWEFARLTHDESLVARATTYTSMMQAFWSIQFTVDLQQEQNEKLTAQRDRYLERAKRMFP